MLTPMPVYFVLPLAILYGLLIALLVPEYSFDYNALVGSASFYREEGTGSIIGLIRNNLIIVNIWDYYLEGISADVSIQMLYGFAAFVRFFVIFTLFDKRLTVPVFLSTIVMMDLNMCRFSLALSILLLIRNKLNIYVKAIALFPLHIFSIAAIFLFEKLRYKVVIGIIALLVTSIIPLYFTRHFHQNGAEFPGIALLYFVFSVILFGTFYKYLKMYSFNYAIFFLAPILLYIIDTPFNPQYHHRFSDLAFQTILIHIIGYSGTNFKYSLFQILMLYFICSLAALYTFMIIGGNIWRIV
jgi:hypothetical protein